MVAALFFLSLKAGRIGIKRLSSLYSGLKFIDNLTMPIELIIWLGYIFWAVDFLFKKAFFYPYLIYILIIIVVSFLTWYLFKDIFAGIIFRIKHNLIPGSYIRAGEITGQIKSQQLTFMKIMTGDGQIIRMPYSMIILEAITELAYPGAPEEHTLHLIVDFSAGRTDDAESLIRTVILNSPWSNLKEDPIIKFLKENEQGYLFEVTLPSINRNQIKFIQLMLEETPAMQILS